MKPTVYAHVNCITEYAFLNSTQKLNRTNTDPLKPSVY